ncbi:hypothetical protein CHLRE_09g386734v5 [Chlamydomonas reinhardtii]|uniref:Uncharacterized protein n=1 Tax=Chlamydomonas reinhardtii TaxID=3055 RepID=A0A2K3DCG0_CHLRE|nr:uncharacterized protein CHLRE_09g386734v5 [Chlamydomonas reinhardtii]PNW78213.1 hypothetical protein CHLRE_09g386734v5 [Chlamydomonas reinhardtii]
MEGLRLGRATVDQLAAVVAGVLADVPPYPPAAFSGRGVVMVGGGLHYLIPAWASLSVLRKSGCHLPVEVWFPVAEQPSRPAVAALEGLGGVAVRTLDVVDLQQRGFALKSAALLLSSFQEVLFLDSDNLAVRDPSPLFASPQYAATGALFWRDFWDRSSVPEIHEVLRFPNEQVPKVTFESGQMVIDKARHWRGLLLAVYMNVYGKTFAELLSCYLGKGDKETFVYAMLAAGEAYWVSPQPPGSAGVVQVLCEPGRAASCRRQFMGNTMVQPGPDGLPLFFHANYEKWDLALPAAFEAYQRRWQVLAPGGQDVVGGVFLNTSYGIGYDVERHVFQVLSALRCAPWFTAYYQLRLALDDPPLPALDGFHPLPNYISFRPFYRLGWSGAYMGLFRPSLGDRLVHAYYRVLRWRLKPLERRLKGKK